MRTLRERDVGVIYITHRMEELRAVGDRVTVLRDGDTVHTGALSESDDRTADSTTWWGARWRPSTSATPLPPGEEVLRVEKLCRRGVLHDVSFSMRAGEIVGLAGLIGAGRTELCRALFGVDAVRLAATCTWGARRCGSARRATRCRRGLALIPEDRQKTGWRRRCRLRRT